MTLLKSIRYASVHALACSLLFACVDIQGPELESLKPNDVLAEVKVRSRALLIAKDDSLQAVVDLIATNDSLLPLDANSIKWASLEPQYVSVSPTGMIYGKEVSDGPIFVTVEYLHKYVTKRDTVSVYVTDGKLDVNQIKLISLDSNRTGGLGILTGSPRLRIDLYKNGALVTKGSMIPIQVDAPAEAVPDPEGGPDGEPVYRITNQKLLIGKFWVRSSLNLYGNEVNDSVSFIGLYNDFVVPAISVSSISPDAPFPPPLLDTIPLNTYQLCAQYLIMNFSMDPVDIVFSDSTAASDGCNPIDAEILAAFGLPVYGDFVGGNVLNVPPFTVAIRRSNTEGVISYKVRKSSTKETLPFANHIRQQDIAP